MSQKNNDQLSKYFFSFRTESSTCANESKGTESLYPREESGGQVKTDVGNCLPSSIARAPAGTVEKDFLTYEL